jgi:hypothetical protein
LSSLFGNGCSIFPTHPSDVELRISDGRHKFADLENEVVSCTKVQNVTARSCDFPDELIMIDLKFYFEGVTLVWLQ